MVLALWCVAAALTPSGPLTAAEAALLLRSGVAEADVLETAVRLGGCVAHDDDEVRELRLAGASEALVDRLVVAEPALRRLRRLAAKFEPARSEAAGLSFLAPKGWRVERDVAGAEGAMVRVISGEGAPGAAPRALFVFVRSRTGLSSRATGAVAEATARIMADRLEGAALRPRALDGGTALLGGRPVELKRLAGARGSEAFEAAVALRVEDDGRLIGVGYLAPAAARDEVRALFEDFAASLAFDGP
jgi:hypothetical protein